MLKTSEEKRIEKEEKELNKLEKTLDYMLANDYCSIEYYDMRMKEIEERRDLLW